MKYSALASGSNGNCYYLASGDGDAILIDAGINTKHIELRMAKLGIDPSSISAIFITHEHSDHIRGLSVFCKRYQVPVYITAGSYKGSRLNLPPELVHIILPNEKVEIGTLSIYGIPKYHDAKEPCSFLVSDGKINVGVLTDLGRACENVKHVIKHVDVLLLEANYDEEMLEKGRYSFYLKNRIRSGWGHISNKLSLEVFLENRTPRLRHLILSHLSGQNNTVEIVEQTFAPHCTGIKLSVATRYEETELFDVYKLENTNVVTISSQQPIYIQQTLFQTANEA
ncbi:MBL fold metallo-hydrolase [Sphingobacterium deserti]|uniref:Beta-lactamase domain protein n=1 Tax=Sphingobacterium deserti TaxID=1229276 RepID=A0A0B8T184_9SPHI|nr:MBL fold metallo-hydrolase [Sphingobacterium deserti]KGE14411.1 beta-lactamase domain protein [Sphingobacterium deserti]